MSPVGTDREITIRAVDDTRDWPAIADVFNHFVRHSLAAYNDEPVGEEFFAARHRVAPQFPFHVVVAGEEIVGFAYLSPFHPARTMAHTASLTYFVLPEHTGRGIGTRLLTRLLEEGRRLGVTNFLAHISSNNEGSIRFHQRHGFTECGRFRAVGRKHGQDFDMVWMQRIEG